MKEINELNRIIDIAENIQKEMHECINSLKQTKRGKSLSYESLKDVFFMLKLAELQEAISKLKV